MISCRNGQNGLKSVLKFIRSSSGSSHTPGFCSAVSWATSETGCVRMALKSVNSQKSQNQRGYIQSLYCTFQFARCLKGILNTRFSFLYLFCVSVVYVFRRKFFCCTVPQYTECLALRKRSPHYFPRAPGCLLPNAHSTLSSCTVPIYKSRFALLSATTTNKVYCTIAGVPKLPN